MLPQLLQPNITPDWSLDTTTAFTIQAKRIIIQFKAPQQSKTKFKALGC